jgi:hypothetical protein
MSSNGASEPANGQNAGATSPGPPTVNVFIDAMVKNATDFLEAYRVIVTEAFTKAQADAYKADDFVSDAAKLWALAFQAMPKPQRAETKDPQ